MEHLSIEKLRSPRSPRRSSESFFYPESGNNSGSSTPFVSAPSSPRCYYYFSAPPSPPRGRETDASTTAAAVPFSWEEKPGTPKKSNSGTAGDANFEKEGIGAIKNSVDHLAAMGFHFSSAPVSPQRDFNFMDGYSQQQQPVNSSNPLDEFEFSSTRMSDAESVASSAMLHADELFFQGQILPLKLPPRLQQHKSNLSLSLQFQDFNPRAQDTSFSPRSAAGSSFVHQLHSPKSPKSPQPPSLLSPKSPTGYRNPKSPRAKSPSRLPKVGSSENKHPSRMQPQSRPPSSISSVRKSLRELLHLNTSNNTSSSGSIMKKDGSVKSSGTDSSKSSRSSSSSSQRFSSSRSSSVSSNKSSGSGRNSFSSRQVNPLPRDFLQNLQAGSTRLSELHLRR